MSCSDSKATGPSAARKGERSGTGGVDPQPLVDDLARRLVDMRLTAPALFLVESFRPLQRVGVNLMYTLRPLLGSFLSPQTWDRAVALLEDPESAERLLNRLEELEDASREQGRGGEGEPKSSPASEEAQP